MRARTPFGLDAALQTGKVTILCGAGVSAPPPSNLPLASALVASARVAFLGRYDAYIRTFAVRPETFFKYVYDLAQSELLEYLKRVLASDKPNSVHLFLATALSAGNHVITTNFDRLIERAGTRLGVQFNRYVSSLSVRKATAGTLFKVHGSIDSSHSLKVTIDQIGLGLNSQRSSMIKELTGRRTVLVLGYSGYDQLDVMPALATCAYTRLIWISHDSSVASPVRAKPPNQFIASLPRVQHYVCDTLSFVHSLGIAFPAPRWKAQRIHTYRASLSSRQRAKLCIDLLMHHNNFRQVVKVIEIENLLRWPEFEDAHFRAYTTFNKKTPSYDLDRKRLLRRVIRQPRQRQVRYAATIAKYADDLRQLQHARSLVAEALALRKKSGITEELLEAGVEVVFQLTEQGVYRDARHLLRKLKIANHKVGSIRAEARLLTVESNLYCSICYYVAKRRTDAQHAYDTAVRAIVLFGRDVFSDEYFLWQARFNAAIALQLLGKQQNAEKIFVQSRRYFATVSKVYPMQADYQIALLRYSAGKYRECEKLLDSIIARNRRLGRRFMLGQVFRMKAFVRYMVRPANDSLISRYLAESAARFDDDGLKMDAAISRRLGDEFARTGLIRMPINLLGSGLKNRSGTRTCRRDEHASACRDKGGATLPRPFVCM
ncbi:MAG: SIR2 family protein [Betaproteobacteria bacterium]|nr:SIR2 family protein [Betaproteobacteria bacterium]